VLPDPFPLTEAGPVFGVLLLLVLAGPLIVRPLRLPDLVGLIAVGMVVGPNVLGVVSGTVLINALGFVGLLYLMFQGGLDLDLDGFRLRRRESVLFGIATFVLPMIAVVGVSLAFDLPLVAAVIIGTALTSHTPLSYPAIARLDLARNPAVTASLGATLLANVAALLVLAVASAGAVNGAGLGYWGRFTVGLVGYVVVMLVVVPPFTAWFFRGVGRDREVRLTYLLSGMVGAAVVAGAIGIEPIVGAFLAGLSFNRFVPDGTLIADRVDFLGRSLFVPAFLVSTGMMLDPVALVTDGRTILLGTALVAAEVLSKWAASSGSGRLFGYPAAERGLMFSLTVGQAAGALAAAVVGQELGVLGASEVNAIILVIMMSALLAGLSADRHAPRAARPDGSGARLGRRVVVSVSNPATVESLLRVAGQVSAGDSGAVVAVNVLPFEATPEQVRVQRDLVDRAERAVLATGSEVTSTIRIDASIEGGVLHSVVEQAGTCLVMGWEGRTGPGGWFGSVIDRVVATSPVPVLVCRPGIDEATERVVLVVTSDEIGMGTNRGLDLAADVATRLARQADTPSLVVTDVSGDELEHRLDGRFVPSEVVTDRDVLGALSRRVRPGDVVLAVTPPTSSRLGRGAYRVASVASDRTVVVVVPH